MHFYIIDKGVVLNNGQWRAMNAHDCTLMSLIKCAELIRHRILN